MLWPSDAPETQRGFPLVVLALLLLGGEAPGPAPSCVPAIVP